MKILKHQGRSFLNFKYFIVFFPQFYSEYIVADEDFIMSYISSLCHLGIYIGLLK